MRTRYINLRIPGRGNETPRAEILVEDGRFVEIGESGSRTAQGEEHWVDLENALVLPGAIDPEVSFGDPGYPLRGDFCSESAAAAAGGVTTVVDLPASSEPPVTRPEIFEKKAAIISAKSHVDFMLWGGIPANAWDDKDWRDRLRSLAESGMAALHLSMHSQLSDYRGLSFEQLVGTLKEAWRIGIPVGLHAQTSEDISRVSAARRDAGDTGPVAWSAAHPVETESAAAAAAREICRSTSVRLHFLSVGAGDALDIILEGSQEGLPITTGTSWPYLEFTREDFEEKGSILKLSPALKSKQDLNRLWQGLREGSIDFIGSQHRALNLPADKTTGSIWTDQCGMPGIELMLPYLYSEGVCTGRISLEKMVELLSGRAAVFFGIDAAKGSLRPGRDADFVVFDDAETWRVDVKRLHGLHPATPLDGRRLTGRVRETYLRGSCIYRRTPDGQEMFGRSGLGHLLRRGPRGAVRHS